MSLTFTLNGESIVLPNASVDPTETLNDYLRTRTRFKGTKIGCGEGGCGACAVLVSGLHGDPSAVSVNSCLFPLARLNNCAVTTTEGLGVSKKQHHPIQRRFAEHNATQCGFCTPGMVMATYAALHSAHSRGLPPPSMRELEAQFDGNICRCTGYRPIADAAKSFARDCGDGGQSRCDERREADAEAGVEAAAPAGTTDGDEAFFPAACVARAPGSTGAGDGGEAEAEAEATVFTGSGRTWIRARNVLDALRAIAGTGDGEGGDGRQAAARIVAAQTSVGVYKAHECEGSIANAETVVDVGGIAELNVLQDIEQDGSRSLVVGAAVSLARLVDALHDSVASMGGDDDTDAGSEAGTDNRRQRLQQRVADHIERVANTHVRNVATVGGNLAMAREQGFESDLAVLLLAAGATVTLARLENDGYATREIDLARFLGIKSIEAPDSAGDPVEASELVVNLTVPLPGGAAHIFDSHKVGLRPHNAHAFVNAAFMVDLDASSPPKITAARFAFGAVRGTKPNQVRATDAEALVVGQQLLPGNVQALIPRLVTAVAEQVAAAIPDSLERASYRRRLCTAFMAKFAARLLVRARVQESDATGAAPEMACAQLHAQQLWNKALPPSSGMQSFQTSVENTPVARAVPKIGAELQASGEAMYAGDIPTEPGTLYGALLLCRKRPTARLSKEGGGLAAVRAQMGSYTGVVTVLGAGDIPGANDCDVMGIEPEPVFAEPGMRLKFNGQPAAIVLADTARHAQAAARALECLLQFDEAGDGVEDEVEEHKGGDGGDGGDGEAVPLTLDAARAVGDKWHLPALGWMAHDFKRGDAEGSLAAAADAQLASSPASGGSETRLTRVIEGTVIVGGQQHFYMEPQTSVASPQEGGGIRIWCSTQGPEVVQKVVSKTCKLPLCDIELKNRRAGGGFGGKLTRQLPVAGAAAIAAYVLDRPVSLTLDRNTDLEISGGRHELEADYKVAYTVAEGRSADGSAAELEVKLTALSVDIAQDGGCTTDLSFFVNHAVANAVEQCYYVPDLAVRAKSFRTATHTRTAMRGPGEIQASIIMETILERVAAASAAAAAEAGMGSLADGASLASAMVHAQRVREQNLFPPTQDVEQHLSHAQADENEAEQADIEQADIKIDDGDEDDIDDDAQATPPPPPSACDVSGVALTHYTIPTLWPRLKAQAQVDQRMAAAAVFNAAHKWRKRGVAMTPVKYKVSVGYMGALVNIYSDGTVVLSHSGSEMGQGLHTKATQVAAATLGRLLGRPLPLGRIRTADSNSLVMPNAPMTGGSTGSEAVCEAVRRSCETLVQRMAPTADKLRAAAAKKAARAGEKAKGQEQGQGGGGAATTASIAEPSWDEVCAKAAKSDAQCHLQASSGYFGRPTPDGEKLLYHNWGAAVSEVELDVLTGETKVLRTDIMYDCGNSLNPAIDIGQSEGAFVCGLGMIMREEVRRDADGALLTKGTWTYKPPLLRDIPHVFNVELLHDARFQKGILSSKASGEPPLVLATSVLAAMRHAIVSARQDRALAADFDLPVPCTVDIVQTACGVTDEELKRTAESL